MKVLHVADTHLGFRAYGKMCREGECPDKRFVNLNMREVDFYESFRRVIDAAISEKVDAVVHAGDLFDSVRPSNRTISFAMEQIARLDEKDIPFVVISGNHSTPRLRDTGSVFRILSFLPNVHAAYRGKYEEMVVGDLHVHALPHCVSQEVFDGEIKKMVSARPGGKYNVAVLHAGVIEVSVFGKNEYTTGEVNENRVSSSRLEALIKGGFDYVALGHYHRHTELLDRVVYAGSTERLSFAESGEKKGFVVVDLDRGERDFHELPVREMVDLRFDYRGQSAVELEDFLVGILDEVGVEGKIIRIVVDDVPPGVQRAMRMARVMEAARGALFFRPDIRVKGEVPDREVFTGRVGSIVREFERYAAGYPIPPGVSREKVVETGKKYLLDAISEGGGEEGTSVDEETMDDDGMDGGGRDAVEADKREQGVGGR